MSNIWEDLGERPPSGHRAAVGATISTAVALFSGFFNILQLTAIDDFDLPGRENNFTLNLRLALLEKMGDVEPPHPGFSGMWFEIPLGWAPNDRSNTQPGFSLEGI